MALSARQRLVPPQTALLGQILFFQPSRLLAEVEVVRKLMAQQAAQAVAEAIGALEHTLAAQEILQAHPPSKGMAGGLGQVLTQVGVQVAVHLLRVQTELLQAAV